MSESVAMYKGKLVMIAYGYDVDTEETEACVNELLGRAWDWDEVWSWYYGDGSAGFGIQPGISKDDPRVVSVRNEIGALLEEGTVGNYMQEIEESDRVVIQYENEDTIVLFVNE